MTEEKDAHTPIKIRQLHIKNYKGIDELELEFPAPHMAGDPDIMVIGSENGIGKTSVLECCALALLGPLWGDGFNCKLGANPDFINPLIKELVCSLIKSSTQISSIHTNFHVGNNNRSLNVTLNNDGSVELILSKVGFVPTGFKNEYRYTSSINERFIDFTKVLMGRSPNPILSPLCLFFHSYRKTQEGNIAPENLIKKDNSLFPDSAFKLEVLKVLMGKSGLLEDISPSEGESTLEKLNALTTTYANGTINKIKLATDNTYDIRVMPEKGTESFSIDGLSSGQKEIISTLFLIWKHTKDNPCVVLIDEPELHLNAQWHRSIIQSLVKMAPQNQYIIATHSETIMDSVDKDRRLLLVAD